MHGDPVPDTYVYVTEEGVARHYADGSVDALAWEDVVEVRVQAAEDSGPDVLVVLLDRDGQVCVVPQSATDASFFTRLRYLPEFDPDRLAAVVADADDIQTVVWRSPEPPSPRMGRDFD
ncbi:hypothetical protein [Rhizohabitans arisaemae]|uniref:hypothetical protein n=1 Tax=Rhizohabitans arisaemae TaxID=2720610 RepID=UPI0024B266F5|nr:hypothetical protein [Rhizohabitans arisaemae]